jgi:hypothetical protein
MNVIVTAHQKDVYGTGFNKVGVTFDSMRGDDYLFDLVFRVERKNGVLIAITEKERAELGKQKFPKDFEWNYENFCKFYGKEIIEREAEPVKMATKEQIERANKLIEVVKVDDETVNKWLAKADVDSFDEMTGEQIQKVIEYLEKKVASLVEKQEETMQAELKDKVEKRKEGKK